ncbi:peptidyl-prolyl cis-trans isomerase sig-7 [Battus philenor]|uniref:peptidyl-prolyl cis-trans isomerase sig-7 n=1 Tax=Battus philenor TaxID=42288 RepID=UPI0035CF3092
MAVVIETTLGDITVDLYLDQRPVTCLNFLKLCKIKYYNFNLFHSIRSGFIAQTGDPSGEGSGGESIWGVLDGPEKRFFSGEKMPKIRHTDAGLLAMVCTGDMMVGSQFYFTLAPNLDSLDGVHCVIGEVTEGREILSKLNEVICDDTHRPYQDVRITHTVILEDPFNDPPGLIPPSRSPSPSAERLRGGRIAPDEDIDETQGKSAAEIQEMVEEKEAKARATILEIVGDLPDADIAPPENVLFVCKLNPVTTDDDLEIIFSRFGKIVNCEVIRDKKTGDSLQYAFIEFADKQSCEDAYFKMDNVLIDDRRIHVDFSQSVSKMKWLGKGRGVKYLNENESKSTTKEESKPRSRSRDRQRSMYDRDRSKNNSNKDRRHSREKDISKHKNYRERSRSRSRTNNHKISSSKRERSPLRDKRKHSNNQHSRREKHHSNHYADSKNDNCNNEKEKSKSFKRNSSQSPERKHRKVDEEYKKHKKHHNDNDKNYNIINENNKQNSSNNEANLYSGNKKSKEVRGEESQTPSPISRRKNEKTRNNHKEKQRIKKNETPNKKMKKKRKPSTSSSDTDSSDSSSSSSSTSSSDSDKKKKKLKRKKRQRSTSSSSSSDSSESSSSSSSSDSSSTTSSSSSDSDQKKRKLKKKGKKLVTKTKNKL